MSLFGGPVAQNDKIVDAQKSEVADAARRAEELKRRREDARAQILAIFQGGDYTAPGGSVNLKLPGWTSEGGYKLGENPNSLANTVLAGGRDANPTLWDTFTQNGSIVPDGTRKWGLLDVSLPTPGKTTTYSGIGDDFYDAYRKSILDYYQPQLADRVSDAQGQNMARFARQGIRQSSAYDRAATKLNKEADLQYANLQASADEATADMRGRIDDEMYGLLDLAAAAEDPTVAVNRALTEVNAVQPAASNLTPLGDIFDAVGTGVRAYDAQRNRNLYASYIPTSNTAGSKFSGSGKTYGR